MIERQVITPRTDRSVTAALITGMLLFGAFTFVMGMRVEVIRQRAAVPVALAADELRTGYHGYVTEPSFRDVEIRDGQSADFTISTGMLDLTTTNVTPDYGNAYIGGDGVLRICQPTCGTPDASGYQVCFANCTHGAH